VYKALAQTHLCKVFKKAFNSLAKVVALVVMPVACRALIQLALTKVPSNVIVQVGCVNAVNSVTTVKIKKGWCVAPALF
jgi:hypothetical protein